MKIVKVVWVDAETIGDSGWQDIADIHQIKECKPPIMSTVGFVLGEYDTHITITDSVGDKECGHVTKIPTSMINQITELTPTTKKK
tara:strand:+ start:577 stop:834 length:258 start_codon:yes stop_codon:yes gene_type:complete